MSSQQPQLHAPRPHLPVSASSSPRFSHAAQIYGSSPPGPDEMGLSMALDANGTRTRSSSVNAAAAAAAGLPPPPGFSTGGRPVSAGSNRTSRQQQQQQNGQHQLPPRLSNLQTDLPPSSSGPIPTRAMTVTDKNRNNNNNTVDSPNDMLPSALSEPPPRGFNKLGDDGSTRPPMPGSGGGRRGSRNNNNQMMVDGISILPLSPLEELMSKSKRDLSKGRRMAKEEGRRRQAAGEGGETPTGSRPESSSGVTKSKSEADLRKKHHHHQHQNQGGHSPQPPLPPPIPNHHQPSPYRQPSPQPGRGIDSSYGPPDGYFDGVSQEQPSSLLQARFRRLSQDTIRTEMSGMTGMTEDIMGGFGGFGGRNNSRDSNLNIPTAGGSKSRSRSSSRVRESEYRDGSNEPEMLRPDVIGRDMAYDGVGPSRDSYMSNATIGTNATGASGATGGGSSFGLGKLDWEIDSQATSRAGDGAGGNVPVDLFPDVSGLRDLDKPKTQEFSNQRRSESPAFDANAFHMTAGQQTGGGGGGYGGYGPPQFDMYGNPIQPLQRRDTVSTFTERVIELSNKRDSFNALKGQHQKPPRPPRNVGEEKVVSHVTGVGRKSPSPSISRPQPERQGSGESSGSATVANRAIDPSGRNSLAQRQWSGDSAGSGGSSGSTTNRHPPSMRPGGGSMAPPQRQHSGDSVRSGASGGGGKAGGRTTSQLSAGSWTLESMGDIGRHHSASPPISGSPRLHPDDAGFGGKRASNASNASSVDMDPADAAVQWATRVSTKQEQAYPSPALSDGSQLSPALPSPLPNKPSSTYQIPQRTSASTPLEQTEFRNKKPGLGIDIGGNSPQVVVGPPTPGHDTSHFANREMDRMSVGSRSSGKSRSSMKEGDRPTSDNPLSHIPPPHSGPLPRESLYSNYSYYNLPSPVDRKGLPSPRPDGRPQSHGVRIDTTALEYIEPRAFPPASSHPSPIGGGGEGAMGLSTTLQKTKAALSPRPEISRNQSKGDGHSNVRSPGDFLQLGIEYHDKGELERAAWCFERSAKLDGGVGPGMMMWGLTLRHGWGCQVNSALGFKWLQKAAETVVENLDHVVHGTAELTEQEKETKAAKSELVLSLHEMGNSFFYGWGVPKDKKMALNYYELAANLGDPDAQQQMGYCYLNGKGCKVDKKKAAKYYRMAVAQGAETFGLSWIFKDKYDE